MENCKVCGKPMRLIPAGISKATGKPYEAFMACPDKCKQPKQSFGTQYARAKIEGNQYENIMDRKAQDISNAQGRKETSITIAGAKRDAGNIVAAMIHSGELKGSDWKIKYQEIAEWILKYNPDELNLEEINVNDIF